MKLRITIEDTTYDVSVEILPDTPAAAPEEDGRGTIPDSVLQPPRKPDIRASDRICRSPIAGIVVSIETSAQQSIRRGDPVVVIEAMKMQNTIEAPLDGVVQEVLVQRGEAVKSGQILCKLLEDAQG